MEGRDAIRAMFLREFARANMVCIVARSFISGRCRLSRLLQTNGANAWTPDGRRPMSRNLYLVLLHRHEHRSTLVLDQDHQEFRPLGTACVPVDEMNIVGAFIEG